MTDKELLRLTERKPFTKAAILSMDKVVFNPVFRPFCEQNYCGMYGANYSCPPVCGTPEQMERRMRTFSRALVLRSEWMIQDYKDKKVVSAAKSVHNAASQEIIKTLRKHGELCLLAGCGCCMLCTPCAMREGKPCKEPEEMYSCMSAYCIYVKDLAEKCGMGYDSKGGIIPFFSLIAFGQNR